MEKTDETTINKETMANEEAKDQGGGAAGVDDEVQPTRSAIVDAADCCQGGFRRRRRSSTTRFSDVEGKQPVSNKVVHEVLITYTLFTSSNLSLIAIN